MSVKKADPLQVSDEEETQDRPFGALLKELRDKPVGRPPRRTQSLRGLRDELMPNYIKAAELAEAGEFYIVSARQRTSQYGAEAVFEIDLGSDQPNKTLTLTESEVRLRLINVVKKHGVIGPLVLRSQKMDNGKDTWAFRDADDPDGDLPF